MRHVARSISTEGRLDAFSLRTSRPYPPGVVFIEQETRKPAGASLRGRTNSSLVPNTIASKTQCQPDAGKEGRDETDDVDRAESAFVEKEL